MPGYAVGQRIRLSGLTMEYLNGAIGNIIGPINAESGRYPVVLNDPELVQRHPDGVLARQGNIERVEYDHDIHEQRSEHDFKDIKDQIEWDFLTSIYGEDQADNVPEIHVYDRRAFKYFAGHYDRQARSFSGDMEEVWRLIRAGENDGLLSKASCWYENFWNSDIS
jgi:hypothetical protein